MERGSKRGKRCSWSVEGMVGSWAARCACRRRVWVWRIELKRGEAELSIEVVPCVKRIERVRWIDQTGATYGAEGAKYQTRVARNAALDVFALEKSIQLSHGKRSSILEARKTVGRVLRLDSEEEVRRLPPSQDSQFRRSERVESLAAPLRTERRDLSDHDVRGDGVVVDLRPASGFACTLRWVRETNLNSKNVRA